MRPERSNVSSGGSIVRIRGRGALVELSSGHDVASSAVAPNGQQLPALTSIPARDLTVAHPESQSPAVEKGKGKKGRRKARAAWISFVGRIVAQVIGAAATIAFGLYMVNRAGQTSNVKKAIAAARSESPAAVATQPIAGRSVAVLPLQNFSSRADQEFFADGLTEALIAELTRVPDLRVISRTSSMAFKGQRAPLPDIARALGARFVVEGSIARDGDLVRVTAQLIDANRDEHVWADSYERPARHVLAVQSEVSAAIADSVRKALRSTKDAAGGLAQ